MEQYLMFSLSLGPMQVLCPWILLGGGVLPEQVFLTLLKCQLLTQHILSFRVIILQNQYLFLFLLAILSPQVQCFCTSVPREQFCCSSFYGLRRRRQWSVQNFSNTHYFSALGSIIVNTFLGLYLLPFATSLWG